MDCSPRLLSVRGIFQARKLGWVAVEKVSDNMASARLSCSALSWPHTLYSVNNYIADLGSTGPACPLAKGHFCLSCISVVFEDSLLLLCCCCCPEEINLSAVPTAPWVFFQSSLVTPNLPWVQWTMWAAGQLPFPSPRESSPPRDWTWVSCIAGRFFTNWATNTHST